MKTIFGNKHGIYLAVLWVIKIMRVYKPLHIRLKPILSPTNPLLSHFLIDKSNQNVISWKLYSCNKKPHTTNENLWLFYPMYGNDSQSEFWIHKFPDIVLFVLLIILNTIIRNTLFFVVKEKSSFNHVMILT